MTQTMITAAGLKTLAFVAQMGGEVNAVVSQRGFNYGASKKLVRDGFLAKVAACENCADWDKFYSGNWPCLRPLKGHKSGNTCQGRVRLTDDGRAALA